MLRMKLANKIIFAFMVVVFLCAGYGSAVFYRSAEKALTAVSSMDPAGVEALVQARKSAVLVGVLGAILGFVTCYFLIKQVVGPVHAMIRALEIHLTKGEAVRVDIPNKDELGVLALYLNQLLSEGKKRDD